MLNNYNHEYETNYVGDIKDISIKNMGRMTLNEL